MITFLGYATVMFIDTSGIFAGFTRMLRGISQEYVETAETSADRSLFGNGWFPVVSVEDCFESGFSDI
jgi:hypothetical protein